MKRNNSIRKIAIIGGTGLIGKALAYKLMEENYWPIIITRNIQKVSPEFEARQWNGKSAEELANIINGCYAVVNLGGESIASGLWTPSRKRRLLTSRYNTTKNLVLALALLHHKPEILLQGSAIGIYGAKTWDADEQTATGKGFLANLATLWESAAQKAETLGVRTVYLRTGLVLSNNGGAFPKILTPFKYFLGGNMGSDKRVIPWIHIDDEVHATVFLLNNANAKGAFNLVAPEKTSQQQFNGLVAKKLHRPFWLHIPAFVFLLLPGQMGKEIFLANQHIKPTALQQLGFKFNFNTASDAIENLISC
jgi:TIGR01777 family protein